jgi:hypothetical protein
MDAAFADHDQPGAEMRGGHLDQFAIGGDECLFLTQERGLWACQGPFPWPASLRSSP